MQCSWYPDLHSTLGRQSEVDFQTREAGTLRQLLGTKLPFVCSTTHLRVHLTSQVKKLKTVCTYKGAPLSVAECEDKEDEHEQNEEAKEKLEACEQDIKNLISDYFRVLESVQGMVHIMRERGERDVYASQVELIFPADGSDSEILDRFNANLARYLPEGETEQEDVARPTSS
mmetsp:Transcript_49341/g.77083  ORF Transcript_49341/g.77083 Transcript_49341/m.77083 type:complete len:173 (-) Transcript_49341:1105-1623(-)